MSRPVNFCRRSAPRCWALAHRTPTVQARLGSLSPSLFSSVGMARHVEPASGPLGARSTATGAPNSTSSQLSNRVPRSGGCGSSVLRNLAQTTANSRSVHVFASLAIDDDGN